MLRVVAAVALTAVLEPMPDRQFLIEGDANGYWILAHKLSAGEDFSIYSPPRYVMRMPGFPAMLAGSILIAGDSLLVARLLLAVLTSLAIFPAYWIGVRIGGKAVGLLSALMIAVMPVYIAFSVTILSETSFAAAILWNVWALIRWSECAPRWKEELKWACLSGVFAVLAIYIRPSWLLFPLAVLPVLCIVSSKRILLRLVSSAVMLMTMIACLIPWGMRNEKVTGHFVLTTLWMGPSLYDGLHPTATGDSDMTFYENDRLMETMSEFEMNQEYKKRAIEFAKQNPGRALELAWYKFRRYWGLWPNADQFRHPLLMAVMALNNGILLFGALWGAWVVRQELRLVVICVLPVLYFSGIHSVFVSSLRYRLPAEFPLIVLTAVGILDLYSRFRRGKGWFEQPKNRVDLPTNPDPGKNS